MAVPMGPGAVRVSALSIGNIIGGIVGGIGGFAAGGPAGAIGGIKIGSKAGGVIFGRGPTPTGGGFPSPRIPFAGGGRGAGGQCPPGTVPTVKGPFGLGGFSCEPIPGVIGPGPGGVVPPFGPANLPTPPSSPPASGGKSGCACGTGSCQTTMEVPVNGPKLSGTRTIKGRFDSCGNFVARRRSIDPSNAKAARRSITRVKTAVRHQNRLVESLQTAAKGITPTRRPRKRSA